MKHFYVEASKSLGYFSTFAKQKFHLPTVRQHPWWKSLALLPFFFLLTQTLWAQTFQLDTKITESITPLQNGASAWGDFNNDYRSDLIMSGLDKDSIAQTFLYINQDSVTFTQLPTNILALQQSSFALADFNNDSFIDVLVTGVDNQGLAVTKLYANQGQASFTEVNASLVGLSKGKVIWVDINNDGQKDILMNGLDSHNKPVTKIYKNTNSAFEEVETDIPGIYNGALVLLDDNQDGQIDLFMNGLNDTQQQVNFLYQNSGKFSFKLDSAALESLFLDGPPADSEQNDSLLTDTLAVGDASVGDFNHDGKTDILLSGKGNDGKVYSKLFLRREKGFEVAQLTLAPIYSGSALLADLDNDGRTDILLSGVSESDSVINLLYHNIADNTVITDTLHFPAKQNVRLALSDYSVDGNLDLVVTGLLKTDTSTTVINRIYKNTAEEKNNGAVFPLAIDDESEPYADVFTLADTAYFSWKPGFDDKTPQQALTYDIYIRMNTTGVLIKSSESNTSGIYLRSVTAPGSLGQTLTYAIGGLPDGDFTWDIVPVDNAFQSGYRFFTSSGGVGGPSVPLKSRNFKICSVKDSSSTEVCGKVTQEFTSPDPAYWYSKKLGLIAKNATKIQFKTDVSDTLYADIIVKNKCAERRYYIFNVSELPKFSLGTKDTTICPKEPLVLDAGKDWKSVNWYDSGKVIQTGPVLNHPFNTPTRVVVEVTNQAGCKTRDSVQVNLFDLPKVANHVITIAESDTARLSASGGATYVWSPATGLSDPTSANPIATPATSTTYYVTITSPKGCIVEDTVQVNVNLCPPVVRLDTNVCIQSQLALSNTQPARWFSKKQGLLASNSTTYTLHVTESDTLYAISISGSTCTSKQEIIVRAADPPSFILPDQIICPNSNLTLEAGSGWRKVQWSAEHINSLPDGNKFEQVIRRPTWIAVELTSMAGCIVMDTMSVTFYPLPQLTQREVTITEGDTITLPTTGQGNYIWSPSLGLDNPQSSSPMAFPTSTTTYQATIQSWDGGCEVRDSIKVNVKRIPPDIFIPTLFTPNDDGHNDDFRIYGAAFQEVTLQVYDRSGSLVYQTNSAKEALSKGWDGAVNGVPQPNGAYVWIIKGSFNNGAEIKYKGKNSGIINLMR